MHPKRHPIRLEYRAGCDADGHLTALRGPHDRRLGVVRVGRHEGARAGRRPRRRPVPRADHRRGVDRGAHQQPGLRRVPGLRRQPGPVRHGGRDGPPGRAGRHQRVGDAQAQRDHARATCGAPARSWTTAAAAPRSASTRIEPHYDAARAAGKAVGLGLGLKNSGLGNGFNEIARAVVRFRDDGMVEVRHCWTEMGQGVHTVALQVAVEELGIEPERIRVLVDTTRELGAGQTTGSRGTLMGAGSVADACRTAMADGCRLDVDYEGEYRVDWTNKIGDGLEHPIIHSAFGYAAQLVIADPETGADREGRRRARRRPGREPAAVRGPDRGLGAHGPRLRAVRGLPRRRAGPADQHDAQEPRHHPAQGHARRSR